VFFSPDSSWIATFLLLLLWRRRRRARELRERPYDEPEHKQIPFIGYQQGGFSIHERLCIVLHSWPLA
jgi:hypothetical protein